MPELRWTLLMVGGVFLVAARLVGAAPAAPGAAVRARARSSTRWSSAATTARAAARPAAGRLAGDARARELPVIEVAPQPSPAPLPEVVDDAPPASPEDSGSRRSARRVRAGCWTAQPADAAPDRRARRVSARAAEALPELAAAPPPVGGLAARRAAPDPGTAAGRAADRALPGRAVRLALAAEGFVLGKFAIFHKPDERGPRGAQCGESQQARYLRPDTMDSQRYGGLNLFAVLPGPKPPPQAFEELLFTARNLSERLHGALQDERGSPLDCGARRAAARAAAQQRRPRRDRDERGGARSASCASRSRSTTTATTCSMIRRSRTPSTTG